MTGGCGCCGTQCRGHKWQCACFSAEKIIGSRCSIADLGVEDVVLACHIHFKVGDSLHERVTVCPLPVSTKPEESGGLMTSLFRVQNMTYIHRQYQNLLERATSCNDSASQQHLVTSGCRSQASTCFKACRMAVCVPGPNDVKRHIWLECLKLASG